MARVLADPAFRSRLSEGALASAPRYTPAANTERLLVMYEDLLD
jgi:hypothetical protein